MRNVIPRDVDFLTTITFVLANPTHIALAIRFDERDAPVPIVLAKKFAADAVSFITRAEHRGILIMRDIVLARKIWALCEIGDVIPEDTFDQIAEMVIMARRRK